MKRIILFVPLLAVTVGCEKVAEAPEGLSDLSLFLMEHFEDEDYDEMVAGTQNIETEILAIDLTGNDRWFELPIMTDAQMGTLNKHAGVIFEEQMPRGMAGLSINPLQDHLDLQMETNQVCIDSGTTKYHTRINTEGGDCFAEGNCDTLVTDAEIRKESIANVWYDYDKIFRTFELEDGRSAMVARGYMPDIYLSDEEKSSWDQIFTLELWVPHPDDSGQTWRWYAIWSHAAISGIVDSLYLEKVKQGIDEGYERADLWIDDAAGVEDWCSEDRDRENDRP